GYFSGITYADAYFLEPESRSDQRRILSIIRTGETTDYYVDVFRSKNQQGGDKFHDYFYHNLGQQLVLSDTAGKPLALQPSDEMGFASGHLFALDYMWDKQSAKTDRDYSADRKMAMPDSNHIYMNLWMKGQAGREVFYFKAPPAKSFRGNHGIPYAVDKEPFLTLAARQHGEAWEHPFVSVFEPTTERGGKSIAHIESFAPKGAALDFVGLIVKSTSGREDLIFSSVNPEMINFRNVHVNGTYAVVATEENSFTLFLGHGTELRAHGITLAADDETNAVLVFKGGQYYLANDQPVTLRLNDGKPSGFEAKGFRKILL